MVRFLLVAIAVCLSLLGPSKLAQAEEIDLKPEQLSFTYRQLVAPYDEVECQHAKKDLGLYEWDVVCKRDGSKQSYTVHLAVTFYPKTSDGVGAYEVLYWVTDWMAPPMQSSHSTSLWIHNSREDNRVTRFDISQGVENDLAGLKMTISLAQSKSSPPN
jgi:hypothetical protein